MMMILTLATGLSYELMMISMQLKGMMIVEH